MLGRPDLVRCRCGAHVLAEGETEYRGHTRAACPAPRRTRRPGRTLAAAREAVIKTALRQVSARLPPDERAARVKALAVQLWAAHYPGTPFAL